MGLYGGKSFGWGSRRYHGFFTWNARVAESVPGHAGCVLQLDSTRAIADVAKPMVSSDPPYYDNIGYSDLSDFFYIWLRALLGPRLPALFSTLLTPKSPELIASAHRHGGNREKAKVFFEEGFGNAFARLHASHHPDYPLSVYYAFKQEESDEDVGDQESSSNLTASTGWETMLAGLVTSGFATTGTWPIRTERGVRTRSLGSNALASSIVLVCRHRPQNAPLATRKEFMAALRQELPNALKNLQHSNIAPVDLVQAAIGPGWPYSRATRR